MPYEKNHMPQDKIQGWTNNLRTRKIIKYSILHANVGIKSKVCYEFQSPGMSLATGSLEFMGY